jgi:hypothetical protein
VIVQRWLGGGPAVVWGIRWWLNDGLGVAWRWTKNGLVMVHCGLAVILGWLSDGLGVAQ